MIPKFGSFIGSSATRFVATSSDPYRGLREIATPFDPSLRREAGLPQTFAQVPLLNPKGADFRVWPMGDNKMVLFLDAPGHPLHGNRMVLPYRTALALASTIVAIVKGESGGNRGVILDDAGQTVPNGRLLSWWIGTLRQTNSKA